MPDKEYSIKNIIFNYDTRFTLKINSMTYSAPLTFYDILKIKFSISVMIKKNNSNVLNVSFDTSLGFLIIMIIINKLDYIYIGIISKLPAILVIFLVSKYFQGFGDRGGSFLARFINK